MSPHLELIAALVGLGGLAVVVNHMIARIGLLEVVLNEGLPPGYETASDSIGAAEATERARLAQGVHIFVSNRCHGCRRLAAELAHAESTGTAPVTFYLVDRARRLDLGAAFENLGIVERDRQDLAELLGADPLPYAIAVGSEGLVAGGVVAEAATIARLARQCGIRAPLRDRSELVEPGS